MAEEAEARKVVPAPGRLPPFTLAPAPLHPRPHPSPQPPPPAPSPSLIHPGPGPHPAPSSTSLSVWLRAALGPISGVSVCHRSPHLRGWGLAAAEEPKGPPFPDTEAPGGAQKGLAGCCLILGAHSCPGLARQVGEEPLKTGSKRGSPWPRAHANREGAGHTPAPASSGSPHGCPADPAPGGPGTASVPRVDGHPPDSLEGSTAKCCGQAGQGLKGDPHSGSTPWGRPCSQAGSREQRGAPSRGSCIWPGIPQPHIRASGLGRWCGSCWGPQDGAPHRPLPGWTSPGGDHSLGK